MEEKSGLLVGKGEVSCSLLLPPESPFVFWSIAGLAYLGLVSTLFPIWSGTGVSMIPYHPIVARARTFFDGRPKAVASEKMKTDFKVRMLLQSLWDLY